METTSETDDTRNEEEMAQDRLNMYVFPTEPTLQLLLRSDPASEVTFGVFQAFCVSTCPFVLCAFTDSRTTKRENVLLRPPPVVTTRRVGRTTTQRRRNVNNRLPRADTGRHVCNFSRQNLGNSTFGDIEMAIFRLECQVQTDASACARSSSHGAKFGFTGQ